MSVFGKRAPQVGGEGLRGPIDIRRNRPAEGVTFKLQVGDGFSGAGCPQENRQLPRHVVRVRLTECGFRTLNRSRGQRFNLNNLIKCFLLEHVKVLSF